MISISNGTRCACTDVIMSSGARATTTTCTRIGTMKTMV